MVLNFMIYNFQLKPEMERYSVFNSVYIRYYKTEKEENGQPMKQLLK